RRRGAGDRGHRVVRRRYDRHPRHHLPCARGGGLGAQVRTRRLFLAHGVRVRDGVGRAGLLGGEGLATLFFGILLGLIGVDLQTGQARFTFGLPELLDGINVIVVAVGLFAVGETLYVASRYRFGKDEIIPLSGSLWMTLEEWKRSWKPWLRGAAIGFPI